jgi:uncharacterized protein YdhG (YjbR/CyaY superfamily)
MKKAKSDNQRSVAKGTRAPKDVDEYIAKVPEPARRMLKKMRVSIRAAVPREAIEVISYRMPAFKDKRVLVWYAAFSEHCSLFPTAAIIKKFEKELKRFTTKKGTIQFPLDKPLPLGLIKKILKARVAQNKSK